MVASYGKSCSVVRKHFSLECLISKTTKTQGSILISYGADKLFSNFPRDEKASFSDRITQCRHIVSYQEAPPK